MDLLQRVVFEYGNLSHITGGREEPLIPNSPVKVDQVEFSFEHGRATVVACPIDDTIDLQEEPIPLPHRYELSGVLPLSRAVGCGAQWVWLLRNQQGFQDGFQIEFGRASGFLALQLMCEASMMRLSILAEPWPTASFSPFDLPSS